MTDSDWQIIERVSKIYGFTIHESDGKRIVTNEPDPNRSAFWWEASEGFAEFFNQVHKFAYECGYNTASRW